MKMKICILLSFVVGCWGIQWKALDDFKKIFKEYSVRALDTISSIEKILNTSSNRSELFLNKTYSNNSVVKRVIGMKLSDKCFAKFVDKENMNLSFQIQVYQLQIPLKNRIVDITERLNYVNSSIDIYQKGVESRLKSCDNGSCMQETDQWLQSSINSLFYTIYPNSSQHSIRKRAVCAYGQFRCNNGNCITGSYYCDNGCDCSDCSDEPRNCVRSCSGFRCKFTFRCIHNITKCDGINDCGDWTDEDLCSPTTTPSYTHVNCRIDAGDFLCDTKKCIGLERVCDGYNDCGDWSDEGDQCESHKCSPECGKNGGVCLSEPMGSKCLYECPPGTYETSKGCSRNPEAPLPTLVQVLDDTPRLIARYSARLKFLETKTTLLLSSSLREIVKCKKDEFTSLSKVIDFSTIIEDKERHSRIVSQASTTTPRTDTDFVSSLG